MHTCEVFCRLETCNLHSICVPSTPSHWLICSRRRSSFLRACLLQGFWYPRWWFPLNSVVFHLRLPGDYACLGQRVHVFVAEPTHVLELAIVVHLPRIPQRHLVDLCCKLSFFFLDSMSLEYPDTNQIWISGRYDGWNISPRTIILVPR